MYAAKNWTDTSTKFETSPRSKYKRIKKYKNINMLLIDTQLRETWLIINSLLTNRIIHLLTHFSGE